MRFKITACLVALAFSFPNMAFACHHHKVAQNKCAPASSPHHHHHLQVPKTIQISSTGISVQRQGGVNIYRGSGSKPDFNVIASNQSLRAARATVKASERRARRAERRARKAERQVKAANARALQFQARSEKRPRTRRYIGNNRFFGSNGFIGNSNFSGATVSLPRSRAGFRGRIKQSAKGRRVKP